MYREQKPIKGKQKDSFRNFSLIGVMNDVNVRFTKNKICILILATVINHPFLLENYIDQFADLKPQTDRFTSLHQDIAFAVSENSDIGGGELFIRLWFRHSKTLSSIFDSAIYRCTLTSHRHAEPREAELGWEALFNRLLVYELERERNEQEKVLADDFTQK